jgi:hypothetical protein
VVCVVLCVRAAVKTGVEDVSNMLLCAGSCLRVCCFDRDFFKNYVLHCHGFVLHTVHQIAVYCHYTVLLLFWILSYLCAKENVIVWLFLFGRFRVKLRGSV